MVNNMDNFEYHIKVLTSVIYEKKRLSFSLYKVVNDYNLTDDEKQIIEKDILDILKNYQKYNYLALQIFPQAKKLEEELLLLLITISRIRRKEDKEVIKKLFDNSIDSLVLQQELKSCFDEIFNNSYEEIKIDDKVKNDPLLYNSIVLEIPKFILEKLTKEYSQEEILLIAKKIKAKELYFLPAYDNYHNSLLGDKLVYNNINYYLTADYSNLVEEEFKKGNIYRITPIEIAAYSLVNNIIPYSNILIIGKGFAPLYFDTYFQNINHNINIVNKTESNKEANEKNIKKFNLKHTNFIYSTIELLKTYLEYKSQDLVINYGNCTRISLSSKYKGILSSIEEKDFIESANIQLGELIEASKFVKPKGKLLFINYSITKDENKDIVEKFLNKHKEFKLIKELNRFENDLSILGYYALFESQ